ncbi:glycosyltransferase family 4 protein [Rhodothermus profundi]|uniref:Glycosyltransferase involved in cell wall bisynthesis n=1 Tax=Rhodothermus profundi TaxID=633813 RepID=A0A1M6XIJ0_9BACT|nr:glycosyltransferase family 4 protein [Rhodothermus profundi]SHL05804.1 Glycosyltransferase involved in cell wall bisynthesis [Rhodothermus profundi]
MRILFVTQRYHPFVGGVETQTRLVVHELARRGHKVQVVATTLRDVRLPVRLRVLGDSLLLPRGQSYKDEGVPVHALTPSVWDRLRMLPIGVRAVPLLARRYHTLRRFGYPFFRRVFAPRLRPFIEWAEVVHSVAGNYLGWTAQEVARALGRPFVVTPYVHPGQYGDGPDDARHWQAADAVLALLETDRKVLVERLGVPPEKVHLYGVVPLLPEQADGAGFRKRHGLGKAPIVLFVGRMNDYKGAPALVQAAPLVWARRPEVHFVFIGPASEEERRIFDGVDARVHYLGRVDEQEKADAYAACDVFCMPSRHEILPAVYLEAWSYGKPVVGGPAPGLRELIEGNEAGIVVAQTPEAIAEGLLHLLQAPEKAHALGENGRRLVQQRYTREALVNVLERIYADCTDRAGG